MYNADAEEQRARAGVDGLDESERYYLEQTALWIESTSRS